MIIAWTYLLHAHYRTKNIEYRYFSQVGKKKHYGRTKNGAFKYWELERCLNEKSTPVPTDVAQNLRFLIGLRHEIEHQMTTRIDDLLSARFQACCINYHDMMVSLFGNKYGIAQHLAVSLQFAALTKAQVDSLEAHPNLPCNIKKYIEGFDGALSTDTYGSQKFAYRVIFVPKTVNHPNQADQAITFIKEDSELAKSVNTTYSVIHETERPKWLPSQIVAKMKAEGYPRFGMQRHTDLWRSRDAKNDAKKFGVFVGKSWYWYDAWVSEVRKHCDDNAQLYR